MITVYGISGLHVARVRAALIQKGLDFEHISVNLKDRSKEFMDLTPIGKIPVIDDDGTVVWDSLNILMYLDSKYPDTYQMLSQDPKEKAKILNVFAVVNNFVDFVVPILVEKFKMAEPMRSKGLSHRSNIYDKQQKADLQVEIARKLDYLKELLNGQEYFTSKFSAADITVISALRFLKFAEIETGDWSNYVDNLMKDEKVAKVFDTENEKGIKEI